MSNRPWMPLYVADYLADTMHLNAAQSGAYLHLIMHYWQHGELPDDDYKLSRIARMRIEDWRRNRPTVESFFQAGWRHARIDSEINRSAEISNKRKAAAKQKHSNSKANAPANAEQLHTQSQSQRKDTVAKATDAGASAAPPNETPEARLWRVGLPDLMALGLTEARARPLIGSWRRDTGDDCERVLGAIMRAREYAVANPAAWITASLKSRKPDAKPQTVQSAAAELVADIRKLNERPGGVRSGEGATPVRLLSQG